MKTVILLALFTLAACAKSTPQYPPLVTKIEQHAAQVHTLTSTVSAVITEVTLRREALLGRTFLYGGTLQFAALREEKEDVAMMGLSLGQFPAQFEIIDDKLRLVTDGRLDFESDINHPSRLIHEFPILRQDEETLTIRAHHASPTVEVMLNGKDSKVGLRASWIRSLQFESADELFLIESSTELMDGTLAEVMETLTPRDRVVPADYQPIYLDDENPFAERFRFLIGGEVYPDRPDQARTKVAAAQRYLLKNNEPIRWWVTKNIPEKYLNDVKNGLEAWNRYSRSMWNRDLVKFEGILPEGVKVGDPRYNLIVWDNVQDADSAYESQNSDPFTGIQTNSTIYLPLAWVNIGKDYWNNGSRTEESEPSAQVSKALQSRTFLGRRLPVHCLDSASMHLSPSSRLSPEEFGRKLLKSVVFHEVGHALGLAHNFKGSLSFDPDKAGSLFSTSIMDYNHYNEEAHAFHSIDSADGPLLEYDRQILSALYNEGKDIKDSDPTLPTCDDDEADAVEGGVDPLCVRYDIGTDPTKQAKRSLELLANAEARNGLMTSLPVALAKTELPDAPEMKTAKDTKTATDAFANALLGTSRMYVSATANSLGYLGSQAVKSLYVFQEDILPEGYDENEMRERALSLLETTVETYAWPQATQDKVQELRTSLEAWLLSTPALQEMPEDERAKALATHLELFDKKLKAGQDASLSSMRTRMFKAVKYSADAPLSFHQRGESTLDLESLVIALLEKGVQAQAGAGERPIAERTAAAASLKAFGNASSAALSRLREVLDVEIRATQDARKRESLRKLRASL